MKDKITRRGRIKNLKKKEGKEEKREKAKGVMLYFMAHEPPPAKEGQEQRKTTSTMYDRSWMGDARTPDTILL